MKTAFNWLLDIIIGLSMEHVWKINETEIEAESKLLKAEQTNNKPTNQSQKKTKPEIHQHELSRCKTFFLAFSFSEYSVRTCYK